VPKEQEEDTVVSGACPVHTQHTHNKMIFMPVGGEDDNQNICPMQNVSCRERGDYGQMLEIKCGFCSVS
jgi:hypothetical protein